MNFSILIFLCIVVFQIADHICAVLYATCKDSDIKRCAGWSSDHICGISGCKNVCYPDLLSCCDCSEVETVSCYPSASVVNLENGKSVTMSELLLGDRVQISKQQNRTELWYRHKEIKTK